MGHGVLPCTVAEQPHGPRPGGPIQRGKWHAALCRGTRARHARDVFTMRSPHTGWSGGALAGGPVAASQHRGAASELAGATRTTPGKEEGAEAH
jgi:hypothetical protein